MVKENIFPVPSSVQGLTAHSTSHISLLWVREHITHFDLKDASSMFLRSASNVGHCHTLQRKLKRNRHCEGETLWKLKMSYHLYVTEILGYKAFFI